MNLSKSLVRTRLERSSKWQKGFNEERPRRSLGYPTPAEFAQLSSLGSVPDALRSEVSNSGSEGLV